MRGADRVWFGEATSSLAKLVVYISGNAGSARIEALKYLCLCESVCTWLSH
jgi:hypothetical protein